MSRFPKADPFYAKMAADLDADRMKRVLAIPVAYHNCGGDEMISVHQILSASDLFNDGKPRTDLIECVAFQPHENGDLHIYCARSKNHTKTPEAIVAELIKSGIPPHRIFPMQIKLGSILGIQAKVLF